MLDRLTYGRSNGLLFFILMTISSLIFIPAVSAENFQKIPIEQAIRESKEAHEMERQYKARELKAERGLQEQLGAKAALPSQYLYDVHYYRIQMKVNTVAESIYARVDMMSTATQDNVTYCDIDLYANMIIDSVWVDDSPATFTRNANVYRVNLPAPVNTGQQFTVRTWYKGHPVEGGFQAFSFEIVSGQTLVSSLSEPYLARTWWPCKDYPEDKADSVDVIVTYPSGMFCTSNGTMSANINNGDGTRTTSWKERYPITTYLVSVTMTNFAHWRDYMNYAPGDSMPVDFWVFPNDSAGARSGYAPTVAMLDTLSRLFGLYPFINEKYAMSAFNWGGAMEHQTNTSIIRNYYAQSMIVHEMGHQWWGDMITCHDWHHIWMNEGFASYVEALWFESLGSFSDLHTYMNGMRYTSGGSIYITDTTNVNSIFGSIVYDKGAWVLHMLRHVVGDATFFDILHTYYNDPRYKWKDVTTEQFRDLCEQVSGVDLHGFFQDWIYGTYYPKYYYSYKSEPTGPNSYRVYVHVRQTQTTNPQIFRMPKIDISIYNGAYFDFQVPMTARENDYVFDLNSVLAAPSSISVDRNDWILKTATSETYAVHIIYDTLKTGNQFASYSDSVIVRGSTGPYTYQLTGGSLPGGLSLGSSSGIVSGVPTDTGTFNFTVTATAQSSSDTKQMTMRVVAAPYVAGDANHDGGVDISDAVYLIQFIFVAGPDPVPLAAGDVNGDCAEDISDVVYLIEYIFAGGPAPVEGCK